MRGVGFSRGFTDFLLDIAHDFVGGVQARFTPNR